MKKLDTKTLTPEQMQFFADHLAFLSTVSPDGTPQVGPKQSMKVLDNQHLTYLEKTKAHAYSNLKNGSKVAVVVADKPSHTNVRIIGTAHIHEGDDYAKKVLGEVDENSPYPVVIDIDEIDD